MMSRQIAIPVHGRTFGKLRRSATNIAAAALWAAGLAASVVPLPRPAIEGGVVAMALTLPDISQALRLPLLACAVLLGALTLRMGDLAPLLAGLDFAAPLAGFLVSVGVLRASLTGGARGAIARGRLDALPPAGRRSAVLLLGFALSPVFLVGMFPLLSPLVAARNDREAEKLASAALFGGALAFL